MKHGGMSLGGIGIHMLIGSNRLPLRFFFFFLMSRPPPGSTLFPYPTLFRSADKDGARQALAQAVGALEGPARARLLVRINAEGTPWHADDLRALAQLVEQGVAGAMVSKEIGRAHA